MCECERNELILSTSTRRGFEVEVEGGFFSVYSSTTNGYGSVPLRFCSSGSVLGWAVYGMNGTTAITVCPVLVWFSRVCYSCILFYRTFPPPMSEQASDSEES
jgi:hypothetical protein